MSRKYVPAMNDEMDSPCLQLAALSKQPTVTKYAICYLLSAVLKIETTASKTELLVNF